MCFQAEMRHDVNDAISARLEVLAAAFRQRGLHADAELALDRLVRSTQRHVVRDVSEGRGLGLIGGIGGHAGRW